MMIPKKSPVFAKKVWTLKTADNKFAKRIKDYNNHLCEYCGRACGQMELSHFHPRGVMATRFCDDNADCFGKWCHAKLEYRKSPNDVYWNWKLKKLGSERFAKLQDLARSKISSLRDTIEEFMTQGPLYE